LPRIKDSIRLRNILVHRNGKMDDETEREVSEQNVLDAMQAAKALVGHIEDRCRELQDNAGPSPF
jgi:uncharacterized protein YutE (UPF0331/DUF86 family)